MKVLYENKEKEYAARLAEPETPRSPRQLSGLSIRKYASADHSPKKGDREYEYPGPP
jgi:hypothetical protein